MVLTLKEKIKQNNKNWIEGDFKVKVLTELEEIKKLINNKQKIKKILSDIHSMSLGNKKITEYILNKQKELK